MAQELSASQCLLLAVDYASDANITALSRLGKLRSDALPTTLLLRILLTYVPESLAPETYHPLINSLLTGELPGPADDTSLDLSPIRDLTRDAAEARAKLVHLLDLALPSQPPEAPHDPFSLFLYHRAYRIDQETGLIPLVAALIRPFTSTQPYLASWYISILLPLLRLQYEYYPQFCFDLSLSDFERLDNHRGVDVLLQHSIRATTTLSRDLKGLVGPWLCGHTRWKRRKAIASEEDSPPIKTMFQGRRVSLSGNTEETRLPDDDWEYVFAWLVAQATTHFDMITNAIEEWNGPSDIDLGGIGSSQDYIDNETMYKLDKRYAQAMFAVCYVVGKSSPDLTDGVHGILVRLATLLDFDPPPELATSVEQLPVIDEKISKPLYEAKSAEILHSSALLEPEHSLTSPTLPAFMLLQMLLYSAYQLQSLGHSISIANVARLRFFDGADEQLGLLLNILRGLAKTGKKREQQWLVDRGRIVWLWSWNIDSEEGALRGAGPLGSIDRDELEKHIMSTMLDTTDFDVVKRVYLDTPQDRYRLSAEDVEHVVLKEALRCYDNATNGNRTRGSMKKAADIIGTFEPSFPESQSISAASALVSATHALSFYSLTLQPGVPFQPANIRVSADPISLILPKLLEQNAKAYTKLDDLISIGQNLAVAVAQLENDKAIDSPIIEKSAVELASSEKLAERRVVYLCIEAALREDDFDTAYSYLVSRLAPESPIPAERAASGESGIARSQGPVDDMSWRAAYLAGRFRPSSEALSVSTHHRIRRLEQRTDLLSLALLLAPTDSLTEILNVYRRCEEEMTVLLQAQDQDEQSSVKGLSARSGNTPDVSSMPGVWTDPRTEGMVFGQKTREVGRLASTLASSSRPSSAPSQTRRQVSGGKADGEAQLDILNVARGAARAFSRNAFPLRPTSPSSLPPKSASGRTRRTSGDGMGQSTEPSLSPASDQGGFSDAYHDEDGNLQHGRVRTRDVVANAVTGGLASGLGWVLGATPVDRED